MARKEFNFCMGLLWEAKRTKTSSWHLVLLTYIWAIYTSEIVVKLFSIRYLLYRYWWNTKIFPFTKKSYIFIARSKDAIFIFHV